MHFDWQSACINANYQSGEQPECALLVEKQQEQPRDEVHALAVTNLGVSNAITHQNILKAGAKRVIHVYDIAGPSAANVFENVALRLCLLQPSAQILQFVLVVAELAFLP